MKNALRTIRGCVTRAALLVVLVSISGCGGMQSAINPAGPQADRLSKLWWLMFYVCAVVFIATIAAVLIAVKQRAINSVVPAPPDLAPPAPAERHKRNVVIAALTITVAILFVFLLVSFSVGRSLTAELAHKNAITIEITGHQWWWEARYDDPAANNIFSTANEIHIPVGVPVTFQLRATDVIHSFWVPNLTGKKDLIPGKTSTIWLQADKPGVYRGQCAEYCGLQHAHMALSIVAQPANEFYEWRRLQAGTALQPPTDSARRGQQVFLSSACVMCHAINGTPAGSNVGPNLTHVASRGTIAAMTRPDTRDDLRQWIVNSQSIKPGNKMPANNLSHDDLEALLDYLQSLK
jgi:cytochrome c oxidase subunit 2